MKGIQSFINEHKKGCIIGVCAFFLILIIFFTIFFIIPSFGNNVYGNRLDGIKDHEIQSSTVKKIKNKIKSQEGVTKVSYHQEGKILNFIITVDGNTKLETAREYAEEVIKGISKKNLKYYDIQVFLNSDENTTVYPTAGYKSNKEDKLIWGNVGGSSE